MNNINQRSPLREADEVSIKDLILKVQKVLFYLISKWKLLLITSLLGGCIGLIYSLTNKPIYKAYLSFALEDDKGGGLSSAMGLASQFGLDIGNNGGGAFSGDNILELMKSRSMVEEALLSKIYINGRAQSLAELYISFNRFREKWNKDKDLKNLHFLPNSNRDNFTIKQDSVLSVLYSLIIKKNLIVEKTDKKLNIIVIRVDSENELFSKYFAELIAKTVSDFYIDTKTKRSAQNVSILQRQVDSVRRELNLAITGVASSTDANPNSNPFLQRLRVPSQKRQIDVQANTVILSQLVANLEVSKISLRKETPLIQIIDKPILPLQIEKIGKIKSFIVGLISLFFLTSIFMLISKAYKSVMR
jgi:hypothetical protein